MTDPIVAARGLLYRYPRSATPALRDLDLEVSAGEIVAATGPSGCGKSTLLYLLGLFLHPSAGSVTICGQAAGGLSDAERSRIRAHAIGFVFQDAAMNSGWTIVENVAEGAIYSGASRAEARRHAQELLDAYGVGDLAERRALEVSGGQAQRAALCRALIREPTVLLADEPTGNLDPRNAAAVLRGLQDAARRGAAVVIVTHAPEVAAACDRSIQIT